MNKAIEKVQGIQKTLLGVSVVDGVPKVSSRDIADIFEKQHNHVLRDVQNILVGLSKSGQSEFGLLNFEDSYYKNSQGKKQPEYLLTRDGFTLLAMGFNGARAMRFKIAYISRFNEMEQFIKSRNIARLEYPELTNMIQSVFNNPAWYYYSNEADMINQIVLGMKAKKFREENGVKDHESIRDFITPRQAELIQKLQSFDVGLVAAVPDFKQRKAALQAYYDKLQYVPRLSA